MAETKRHAASRKKLEQSRKDGRVLKSQLFTQASVLTICLLWAISALRGYWVKNEMLLQYLIVEGFNYPGLCLKLAALLLVKVTLITLAPPLAVGIAAEILQVGLRFDPGLVVPKASRLDFINGLKGCVAGLKTIWQHFLRLVIFSLVFFGFFSGLLTTMPAEFLSAGWRFELPELFTRLVLTGGAVLMFSGGVDYLVRRKSYLAELSMDDDEIRREHRDDEGDPLMRSLRRAQHEALLMQEMVRRVRSSRVIVVEKA